MTDGTEVSVVDLPATEADPAANAPAPEDASSAPAAAAVPKSAVDALLSGEVPEDIRFYQQQALESEPELTAEDLEALGARGKMLVATLLARAEKAKAEVAAFQQEQDGKVAAATDTLTAAQAERAAALEWTRGQNVAAQREQVKQVLADQTPLDPNDPAYLQRVIDRAVAARMAEFFTAVDTDAQSRDAQVAQTKLDQSYQQYVSAYEQFTTAHKDEFVVPGQKETVTRWTGQHDAQGQPIMQQYVIDKRTPLAVKVEEVLHRYGADPADPRRFRMPMEHAYTLALNELSATTDQAEHEASMARARERVVRPTSRQAPQLKFPTDPAEQAEFLLKNPDWVAEMNRRHFGA